MTVVRLTLKVVMQTDGDVVDVIVLWNNFQLKFQRPSINAARIAEVILGSYSGGKNWRSLGFVGPHVCTRLY